MSTLISFIVSVVHLYFGLPALAGDRLRRRFAGGRSDSRHGGFRGSLLYPEKKALHRGPRTRLIERFGNARRLRGCKVVFVAVAASLAAVNIPLQARVNSVQGFFQYSDRLVDFLFGDDEWRGDEKMVAHLGGSASRAGVEDKAVSERLFGDALGDPELPQVGHVRFVVLNKVDAREKPFFRVRRPPADDP